MQHQISSSGSIAPDQRERGLHARTQLTFNRSISPEPAPSYSGHAASPHRSFRESGSSSERMIFRIRQKSQMHNGHLTADDRQLLHDLEASQDQINAVSQWRGRIRGGGQMISSATSTIGEIAAGDSPSSSGSDIPDTLLDRSWELTAEQIRRAKASPTKTRNASESSVNAFDILLVKERSGQMPSHVGLVAQERDGKKKVLESSPCVSRDRYGRIVSDEPSVRQTDLRTFYRINNDRLVRVASPAPGVKPLLAGKETKAMIDFKKYDKKHYNRSMIEWESRRDKSIGKDKYTCAELVRAMVNDQLPSGADVAAPKKMYFTEDGQEEFYRGINNGESPPRGALGIGPGDFVARGSYDLQAKIDLSRIE